MPLAKLRRESHHVFRMAITTRTNPITEPVAPSGERQGSFARSAALIVRRKRAWEASETSHESNSPNSAALRIETNACCGAQRSSTSARRIENDDTITASVGEPARLRRPSEGGAQPLRESEKSVRDAAYSAAFAPESAAVSTAKFIRCPAPGMRTVRNTVTNGDSRTPAWFHGITPVRTTIAPK